MQTSETSKKGFNPRDSRKSLEEIPLSFARAMGKGVAPLTRAPSAPPTVAEGRSGKSANDIKSSFAGWVVARGHNEGVGAQAATRNDHGEPPKKANSVTLSPSHSLSRCVCVYIFIYMYASSSCCICIHVCFTIGSCLILRDPNKKVSTSGSSNEDPSS